MWSRWTVRDAEFLRESHEKLTRDQIVVYFKNKHSKDSVYKKISELQIRPKEEQKTPEWDSSILNAVKEMKKEGYRVVDISETLGISLKDTKSIITYLKGILSYEERVYYDLLSLKERKAEVDRLVVNQ